MAVPVGIRRSVCQRTVTPGVDQPTGAVIIPVGFLERTKNENVYATKDGHASTSV